MAPRANWKGYLKLSLVSCGVALISATSTIQRIRFNIINRHTGNRVRYQHVDSETGEDVPEEDRVKGYKVTDGSYVLKQAGNEPPSSPSRKPSNVINLMDALRRSVKADRDTETPKRGKRGSSAPHSNAKAKTASKVKRLKRAS